MPSGLYDTSAPPATTPIVASTSAVVAHLVCSRSPTPRHFEIPSFTLHSRGFFFPSAYDAHPSPRFLGQDVLLSGLLNRDLNPAFNHIRGLKDIVECK